MKNSYYLASEYLECRICQGTYIVLWRQVVKHDIFLDSPNSKDSDALISDEETSDKETRDSRSIAGWDHVANLAEFLFDLSSNKPIWNEKAKTTVDLYSKPLDYDKKPRENEAFFDYDKSSWKRN